MKIACDSAVLDMLDTGSYQDYGYTLINFAEKISLSPFFQQSRGHNQTAGTADTEHCPLPKAIFFKKIRKPLPFSLPLPSSLPGSVPLLTSYGAANDQYPWDTSGKNISVLDLSDCFGQYDGSFVLYDQNNDHWSLYNMDMATARTAPDSTYKIYNALFALEEEIITPEHSLLPWDQKDYPFDTWEQDQTLQTAMAASVNWYFQTLDDHLGNDALQSYMEKVGYGNENIGSDLSSYWLESTLKISPVEQVELLSRTFGQNAFGFAPENIQAVKDSICLSSSAAGTLYGKTGTGRVDGQDISGWFIGFIETSENMYFFATNIQAEANATGSAAAETAFSVLSLLDLWQQR